MKILMLCGVVAKENVLEVMEHSRGGADFAANLFQQKLICGFQELHHDFSVISAPFIGSFPNGSDTLYFRDFREKQNECTYVSFNNIWGLRNFSREHALKRELKEFIACKDKQKLIVVYCPHTPFLKAAVYAKHKDPSIKICLYVPDLPQFMNLNAKRSVIYDVAKKHDVMVLNRLMEQVDSFVLLTEHMKDMLPIGNKPYRVIEGIVDKIPENVLSEEYTCGIQKKYVVYTGKLNEKFGVKSLIDSFQYIDDPDYRLVLCGSGDCEEYAAEAASRDTRIMPVGQVSPEEAKLWQSKASVLVNPRANSGEYTKYSFPSKIIEYLLTGKPVVAYMLDGMPTVYSKFLNCIDQDLPAPEGIAAAVRDALERECNQAVIRKRMFVQYAENRLKADNVAQVVLDLSINN